MENFAKLITSLSQIIWPLIPIFLLFYFRKSIKKLIENGADIAFEFMGSKVSILPTKRNLSGNDQHSENKLPAISTDEDLPADYYYVNHISFYRQDKQESLRKKTDLNIDLYYLHITTNSYYAGAIERVEKVEYYLHETYPEPIHVRTNKNNDNFLLKELAYGEFVLIAKIFLRKKKNPLILNRYINLTKA